MAHLEDLTAGALVGGVVPDAAVTVVNLAWHGSEVVTLTYRAADGAVAEKLLFRDDEPRLTLVEEGRPWSFDGDGDAFRLASEAKRISLAYLFDPYVAVSTSLVEPLPHQITAVYQEMLGRQPLNFLLADDPGAGKTIMTGLYIRELLVRAELRRCLIVVPGSLVEQWQAELAEKFHLAFDLLTNETIAGAPSGNPFGEHDLLIARLDKLARDEELQVLLDNAPDWDLVVFDEAHKLSATLFADEVKETMRRKLAVRLRPHTRNLLLLTATPHNGKEPDFELFMSLLDPDRFAGHRRAAAGVVPPAPSTDDLMRRLVKEQLVKFDGRPLFPPRFAYVVPYELSDPEANLYERVTTYVREEMNRADRLKEEGQGRRGTIVGFALTVLQRRLASSPEAIYQSLGRRRERLERTLAETEQLRLGVEARLGQPELERISLAKVRELSEGGDARSDGDYDPDDATAAEAEEVEESAVDLATAARTITELRAEIETLRGLEALAADVRRRATDTKWNELSRLFQDAPEMVDAGGGRRKLIVFTEHRDTLNYLVGRIGTFLGREEAIVAIHGGLPRDQRRAAEARFKNDPDAIVLVATDAAGEGINLQRAHLMVNYDLPWNPNRLEQRFGRIHRIGQTEVCHLWNLVAHRTREGDVYLRLLEKLEAQKAALGDAVFNVLGQITFEGKSLRDLLIDAVRRGDSPEMRLWLTQVLDTALDRDHLRALLDERALGADVLDTRTVATVRDDLERAEARRLQPHYVRGFFLEAFRGLGGQVREREPGRYELTKVPGRIRERAREAAYRPAVLPVYERIAFEKELVAAPGRPLAEFVCPGHPLLEATIDLVLHDHRDLLRRGALLVNPADPSDQLAALVYLEHSVVDARPNRTGGPSVVSRRLEFVELTETASRGAGAAPYLDYRPATAEERALLEPAIHAATWLTGSVIERRALDHAIESLTRAHLAEVRERTLGRIERTRREVHARLTYEINYWDGRAWRLEQEEAAGKAVQLPSLQAHRRADDLRERLRARNGELDLEAQIDALPPVVVGGAIVVPQGLLDRVGGRPAPEVDLFARETRRVEALAMAAVMAAETAAGRAPRDVSADNLGWDVESRAPDGRLRFIEVKGRAEGATTVTVTRNEVAKSFNVPDQWFLAIVEVHGDDTGEVTYLRRPFTKTLEDAAASANYPLRELFAQGHRVGVGA
ncbi:MAG: helicase-related protein [Candidatus Limnocylindrales bacterium]